MKKNDDMERLKRASWERWRAHQEYYENTVGKWQNANWRCVSENYEPEKKGMSETTKAQIITYVLMILLFILLFILCSCNGPTIKRHPKQVIYREKVDEVDGKEVWKTSYYTLDHTEYDTIVPRHKSTIEIGH